MKTIANLTVHKYISAVQAEGSRVVWAVCSVENPEVQTASGYYYGTQYELKQARDRIEHHLYAWGVRHSMIFVQDDNCMSNKLARHLAKRIRARLDEQK